MAKALVIVESPAKAATLGKFLGKDFSVMACYGHVRDLKKKGIPLDRKALAHLAMHDSAGFDAVVNAVRE